MPDDYLINNPGTTPVPASTSGFDTTSDMASSPDGEPSQPFSLAKGGNNGKGVSVSSHPSPLEINAAASSNPFSVQQVSAESMALQANTISSQYEKATTLLQDPSLAQNQHLIKASTAELLSQHLERVNDAMSSLSTKLETPLTTTYTAPSSGTQAVSHFLNYLTGGQQDIINMTNSLKNNSGTLNPGELFAVQLKMSGVQQQMEFFSTLLGKAVDNIKTIMNIQN
ncbi:MAG: hypothetical protein NTY13_04810 [Chlamydiae bacterium]|nr:hypothetical protein [Chlamydiota bacterium]